MVPFLSVVKPLTGRPLQRLVSLLASVVKESKSEDKCNISAAANSVVVYNDVPCSLERATNMFLISNVTSIYIMHVVLKK